MTTTRLRTPAVIKRYMTNGITLPSGCGDGCLFFFRHTDNIRAATRNLMNPEANAAVQGTTPTFDADGLMVTAGLASCLKTASYETLNLTFMSIAQVLSPLSQDVAGKAALISNFKSNSRGVTFAVEGQYGTNAKADPAGIIHQYTYIGGKFEDGNIVEPTGNSRLMNARFMVVEEGVGVGLRNFTQNASGSLARTGARTVSAEGLPYLIGANYSASFEASTRHLVSAAWMRRLTTQNEADMKAFATQYAAYLVPGLVV